MAGGKRSDAIVARTIQRAAEQMETEYQAARAGDAERLYEAFTAAIDEQRPNVEVLLFVLEIMQHGLIEQKSRELFAQAGAPVEMGHARSNGHVHLEVVTDDLVQTPLR